jgi:hypothetical protein
MAAQLDEEGNALAVLEQLGRSGVVLEVRDGELLWSPPISAPLETLSRYDALIKRHRRELIYLVVLGPEQTPPGDHRGRDEEFTLPEKRR